LARPNDTEFRALAVSDLERLLSIAESLADELPFDGWSSDKALKGGVIAAGHANLLRAGYAVLGGARPEILDTFHARSAALAALFLRSPTGSLESYPGLIWPVDNCCALESLRLHDSLFGTDYAEACRGWERWMANHLDSDTGMMVAQISEAGVVLQGPRGCALSWSLAFMPTFAPELARSQYGHYRDEWFRQVFGATGAREWPPGYEGFVDADTGPILLDVGAGASGFGLAAARANGDWENLRGMIRGMECLGFPAWTWRGEKRYFGGHLLLGEVLALWGKTLRPWDVADGADAMPGPWPKPERSSFWLTLLIVSLIAALPSALAFVSLRNAWGSARGDREILAKRRTLVRLVLAVHGVTLLAWIVVPGLGWFPVLLIMGVVDAVESAEIARTATRCAGTPEAPSDTNRRTARE
jgi:hypothetical protein